MLREMGVDDPDAWVDLLFELRTGGNSWAHDGPPPYLGLAPFGRENTDRIFGREALLERALTRWRSLRTDDGQPNLLLLVGAS